jgi:hypothetical protein
MRAFLLAVALVASHCSVAAELPRDNVELARLFGEDQADRNVASGALIGQIDWEKVSVRDDAREVRIKEMLAQGALVTGTDYYHAAMILQHAPTPDDYLLAHDLCVIAISKGEMRGKWLAAASLDRFLINVGRPQRFGTQFASRRMNQPPSLAAVDTSVPDSLRVALDVPTLADARKKESELAKEFAESRRAAPVK